MRASDAAARRCVARGAGRARCRCRCSCSSCCCRCSCSSCCCRRRRCCCNNSCRDCSALVVSDLPSIRRDSASELNYSRYFSVESEKVFINLNVTLTAWEGPGPSRESEGPRLPDRKALTRSRCGRCRSVQRTSHRAPLITCRVAQARCLDSSFDLAVMPTLPPAYELPRFRACLLASSLDDSIAR